MAKEKLVPLDELLFGSKHDLMAKSVPSLAEIISACCRKGLARPLRDQTARAEAKDQQGPDLRFRPPTPPE